VSGKVSVSGDRRHLCRFLMPGGLFPGLVQVGTEPAMSGDQALLKRGYPHRHQCFPQIFYSVPRVFLLHL